MLEVFLAKHTTHTTQYTVMALFSTFPMWKRNPNIDNGKRERENSIVSGTVQSIDGPIN